MSIRNLIIIAIITLLPIFELRLSIPVGILILKENFLIVILIAFLINIIDATFAFYIWKLIIRVANKIKFIEKIYEKKLNKIQKKIEPKVKKFGLLGLSFFIGIPLPGTGAYTGAIAADLLGMNYKDFIKAAILGITIALIIITTITLIFQGSLSYLGYTQDKIQLISRLFKI